MSQSDNRYQAERWLMTAQEDLQAAEALVAVEMFSQACFLVQQAAEKAVKDLWHLEDADPWGHSVKRLIVDFPRKEQIIDLEDWVDSAALLDKFYIPTRYPNGLPDLTPGQIYIMDDARRGLAAARMLVEACRKWIEDH